MSSFGGENLFGSGPHRVVVGGVSQRHEVHETPGADGVRITALGRTGRTIEQSGTLVADDAAALREQTGAIEAAMDGRAAELVDEMGRAWPNAVMLAFRPGPVRRVGPRVAVDYTVRYAQT